MNFTVTSDSPSYTPYYSFEPVSDEQIAEELHAEILWQWATEANDELPPDFEQQVEEGTLDWEPASVAQQMALECEADITLFGGKAGVYKSETLLVWGSLEIDNPNFYGIIFRQSFPELRDLIKKSLRLYLPLGGKFTKGSPLLWTFPSGAQLWMGYMGHDDDVYAHQGSEYSAIAFDEAGHQTEARIRYMLTRLRSPDKTLRLRMFLTANPGGQGHAMLMHMFLKGVCPHCEPSRAVENGKLYYDATWKSDGQPLTVTLPNGNTIPRSVAFINGRLQSGDKDLLGDEYTANLMTQAAATAQMLLDGCWKAWEGQFFDCFQETRGLAFDRGRVTVLEPDTRMVVPRTELEIKPWYPHLIGGDYGFSGSAAAALLLVRTPPSPYWKNGRVYVIDEYVERGKTAEDYAGDLLERWFLDADGQTPEHPRSLQLWALSPDAWRKDGSVNDINVPFSRLEQMNAILGPYGFEFVRANDDRKSGWMKLYQMLRDGELVICRNCVNVIEMFQTRLKDEKKLDDIKKVAGDPLDDIADALRYAIMTWALVDTKPRAERIAEAIEGLDPTNAAMTVRQMDIADRRTSTAQTVSFAPKARRRPW